MQIPINKYDLHGRVTQIFDILTVESYKIKTDIYESDKTFHK